MPDKWQSPGVQAGASRDQLGRWSQLPDTPSHSQAQMLACRFCLSPWMARDIASLCFGSGFDE